MSSSPRRSYLIVNADDYGYFRCVSRGILECVAHGIVTATSVLPNAPLLDEHAAWLRDFDQLDVGAHLNLTHGLPLTQALRKKLGRWDGRFPTKAGTAMAVLSGLISPADVLGEWRAQIERCREQGLCIAFLNSHEHVHMLPPLYEIASSLAAEYGIAHVRFSTSLAWPWSSPGGLLRAGAISAFAAINRRRRAPMAPQLLGMASSGRLTLDRLASEFANLRAGGVYELMCHPGQDPGDEVHDHGLLSYHRWKEELDALTSAAVPEMLERHGIRLIRYRDLELDDGRLAPRP